MANEIEWATLPSPLDRTNMSMVIVDNTTGAPTVLLQGPFTVNVSWTVPAPYVCFLDGTFRLRVFAESLGPGPEVLLAEKNVPAICGAASYVNEPVLVTTVLPGEGTGTPEVSGVYKIVVVLQYINSAGAHQPISGFATSSAVQIRNP
jgi:hypothetical protein